MKQITNRFGQKLLLKNDRHEVLILQSSKNNPRECWEYWDFPGGGLEPGESLEESLKREVVEEIGPVKYRLGKLLTIWDAQFKDRPGIRMIAALYEAYYQGGKIELSPEHVSYRWIPLADLLNRPDLFPKPSRQLIEKLKRALG